MKLNQAQIAIAAVAGTLAVVGFGSAIHTASVREQNCLSYERQSKAELTKMGDLVAKGQSMVDMINENPFAAFGLLGELMPLQNDVQATSKALNDTKYAYIKSCGEARFDKFVGSPEVRAQVDAISKGADALSN